MKKQLLKAILYALPKMLSVTALRYPAFRARLKEKNVVAWMGLRDGSIGRIIEFRDGKVLSRKGPRESADVRMVFVDVETALAFMTPNPNQLEIIHAAKNFKVAAEGEDGLLLWFTQTLATSRTVGLEMGVPMPDGSRRFTTCTNGGPVFVYVKDGRILRVTPIELAEDDAASWSIEARGRKLTPKRRAQPAPACS